MEQIQFIGTTPNALVNLIDEVVKRQLEDLKKSYQPKEPNEYLTRNNVAELLSVDLSTVHNWTKKGILHAKQIGGRVFYLREEVENAIVKLKK
ncbi:helix-turn-helix domain-containing protein [Olleya sp. AH-315-F22]|nr:helix-turn-helix domain-containing protein [Olleya sp. AH-315-F22]